MQGTQLKLLVMTYEERKEQKNLWLAKMALLLQALRYLFRLGLLVPRQNLPKTFS